MGEKHLTFHCCRGDADTDNTEFSYLGVNCHYGLVPQHEQHPNADREAANSLKYQKVAAGLIVDEGVFQWQTR